MADHNQSNNPAISTPTPDPTAATNQAIELSRFSTRDYVDGRFEALAERLRGIDKANEVLSVTVNRVPTETQTAVGNLNSLTDEQFAGVSKEFRERTKRMEEKFDSIQIQFKERDTRQERESRDNKVAVEAAFAAQKEAAAKQDESNQKAIDKSEASTQEKITKLSELFTTTINALGDKIDDLKSRTSRIESLKTGSELTVGKIYAAIGAVGVVLSIIILLSNGVLK